MTTVDIWDASTSDRPAVGGKLSLILHIACGEPRSNFRMISTVCGSMYDIPHIHITMLTAILKCHDIYSCRDPRTQRGGDFWICDALKRVKEYTE